MNLQSGALVGFVAAVGGVGGAVFGYVGGALVGATKPAEIAAGFGMLGGLLGAFVGGVIVSPDPTATASTGTAATGTSGLGRPLVQLNLTRPVYAGRPRLAAYPVGRR